MRRDHGAPRIAAVAAAGTCGLVVAAVAVPLATGAPRPELSDLVVTAGFGAGAARVALDGRHRTALMLGVAAGAWALTGLATSMPDHLVVPVSRLVLVPHALVVVALAAAIPATGRPSRSQIALTATLAGMAAVAAGVGWDLPVLAILGAALLVAAYPGVPEKRPGVRAATAALGITLVVLDPRVLGSATEPRVLAIGVDMVLLGVAAVVARHETADARHPFEVTAAEPGRDEVAAWLAGTLGVPDLQVAFPAGEGAVDAAGRAVAPPYDEALFLRDDDAVVAYVTPAVQIDDAVHGSLASMLRRLGEVARLRAECREKAEAIATSRGRLQAAADEESRRLERQLDDTLIARLDRVDSLLRGSSSSALTERVRDVRVELLRHARGLDPLAGRTLADALAAYRARGVRVEVGELGDVNPACARTAWYAATEGITNATKHAPGAGVRLDVVREAASLIVCVHDEGPGGADPKGAGLQGLADRVAAAGGKLSVTSGPDGTTLRCTISVTGNPAVPMRENADPTLARRS